MEKKAPVVEAIQWFKNGDHPADGTEVFESGKFKGEPFEGKAVRYYRTPDLDGQVKCEKCGTIMHLHGWIDVPEEGHTICPGDWVTVSYDGEPYVFPVSTLPTNR